MAVANNVGLEESDMEVGIGRRMGIGLGHSLTVPRSHSISVVDAVDSSQGNTFTTPCLDGQQESHSCDDEGHVNQAQLQHRRIPDVSQQSKPPKSTSTLSKLHTNIHHTHLQLSSVNEVATLDEAGIKDDFGSDAGGDVRTSSMQELEDLLTKLNPLAKEFIPPSQSDGSSSVLSPCVTKGGLRKKNGLNVSGRRRVSNRGHRAHREDSVRRTVYVSDIDQQVTEEQLAALFITCGQVVDCRVCGDPNSVLRFAFVEFTDEVGARAALSLAGTMLGYYPVRVLPSKTAIVPVNPTFLPRSEDEREMCARTIYCTNIDKKVSQADVKLFFESLCGEVSRLRLLGDYHHSTRIAFVEFVLAESAMAALNCSGAILGSLPIRVSPSKTPVRPRSPRSAVH